MLAFACALGIYMFFEARVLKVRRLTLELATLPEPFDGYRILHVSDLHLMRFGTIPHQLLNVLPTLPVDLVAFTGDYKRHTYSSDAPIPAWMGQIARACRARDGMVAVLGNKDNAAMKKALAPHGLRVLLDESVAIERSGEGINILGVRDANPVREPERAARILDGLPREGFRVLLAHTPDYVRLASEHDIELVLAGDTHGGQVLLPVLGAIKVKSKLGRRYCRGLIRQGGTLLHISAGCGTANVPFRFRCPPEISVLTLRRPEASQQAEKRH